MSLQEKIATNNLSNQGFKVVILAAGVGSRMKSSLPKPMHLLGGVPMLEHLLYKAHILNANQIITVIGEEASDLKQFLENYQQNFKKEQAAKQSDKQQNCRHKIAYQQEKLGSAHAVLAAEQALGAKEGVLLIMYADTPLVHHGALKGLVEKVQSGKEDMAILAFSTNSPNNYGKLMLKDDKVIAIIEAAEITDHRVSTLCNSGIMAINLAKMWPLLKQIDNHNNKHEYYLTDLVKLATQNNLICAYILGEEQSLQGANTKEELSKLESSFQNMQRQKFLQQGVHLIDPKTIYFALDTIIEEDVIIYPNVYFGEKVIIKSGARILPFCVLEGVQVGKSSSIGPFARLRPGTILEENTHIGNFVEIKKSHIQAGAKINHLSYIGDAKVGKKTNIGAGTITCNYDGKEKFNTIIEDNCFIGSNSSLVAPVKISSGAIIGAGSTITKDVPTDALAITRPLQKNLPNWRKK
ncbi:bifunctional UDP-N-acetylglucosamine diphosphorylase/glucosamine-1-phosphate N-acetyltransferase GlmU [Candidatus Hepatincolaceae symbiont of Richtersius coronifer]